MLIGVIGAVGFVGWRVWQSKTQPDGVLNQALKSSMSTGATLSKLHVSGNRIVNQEGQTVRLRGVNFEDPFALEHDRNINYQPDNHFAVIETDFARVKALGANVVRLPLYPGYYWLVGGEKYPSTYVDRLVDLAEKYQLYAIISYHAIGRPGGWYEPDIDYLIPNPTVKLYYSDTEMAVSFWNKVASRYGQRKHVIFEFWNEPADQDPANFRWADWRPTGQTLIGTIRQHSNNLIIGSGPSFTSDLSEVPQNPYADPNLAYAAHVYPSTIPKGDDPVSDWEKMYGSLAKIRPVIVTEWGFHDGTKDATTNGSLVGFGRPLLDYLDQRSISWVAFIWHPAPDEPPLIESDWTTLTEFGQLVKQRLGH